MTSHEYARKLHELADWLLTRAEFPGPYSNTPKVEFFYADKDNFLEAARALGSGRKRTISDQLFEFTPDTPEGTVFNINIARDKICRKVQDAVWECEPLLNREEEASVGAGPTYVEEVANG